MFILCNTFVSHRFRQICEQNLCHESCPCTPGYSPPEVTCSLHGLLHHTNDCTSPKTTFPIIHCTERNTADHTNHAVDRTSVCSALVGSCSVCSTVEVGCLALVILCPALVVFCSGLVVPCSAVEICCSALVGPSLV